MALTRTVSLAMNTKDEQFFKLLGGRIAQARKAKAITQQQLADQLSIAQQTLAHYEVGRLRLPASLLPMLADVLEVSVDDLLGLSAAKPAGKRGPASRLQQQIEAVAQLPRAKQQFVSQMLDTVLAQAGH